MQHAWLSMTVQHFRVLNRAYLVLCLSLAMTALAGYFSHANFELRERQRFEALAQDLAHDAQQRIEAYVDTLHGLLGLFSASVSVERDEFANYVATTGLVERHPGLKGLVFAQHVAAADLPAFIDSVRNDTRLDPAGYADFGNTLLPGAAAYLVATYVEPLNVNRSSFGHDLLSESNRREAALKARDTGRIVVTDAIDLTPFDPASNLTGIVIMAPVYANSRSLNTLAERRSAFAGVVYARIAFTDFFPKLLSGPFATGFALTVRDQSGKQMYTSREGAVATPDRFTKTHEIMVGDEAWSLAIESETVGSATLWHNPAIPLIGIGLLVSGILFGLVSTLQRGAATLQAQDALLAHQASHDSLTDLPNRSQVYRELSRAIDSGACSTGHLALLLLDLNGFKEINDTLGHHSGDRLLRMIGPRLQTFCATGDMVARMGGDEFAILLCSANSRAEVLRKAQQILAGLQEPFLLDGLNLRVSASIGIALHPQHGQDVSTLMRCADIAMYQAKHDVHGICVYEPGLDEHNPRRLARMNELDQAIRGEGLMLHFQPILSIADQRLDRVEALLRWQHPEDGMIPPMEFIPQAEQCELITPLTLWVVDHALEQIRQWQEAGFDLRVAVNISARNLQDTALPEKLGALLRKHDVTPDRLELEITESAIISDPERTKDTIKRLVRQGFAIAIDDFGTGYTSLAYLKTLSASHLKIDRSFVCDIMHDDNDAVIVRSIIDLAHNLGMKVIAEGVENQEILDVLEILRCDLAQGYHLARPMAPDALLSWIRSGRTAGPASTRQPQRPSLRPH